MAEPNDRRAQERFPVNSDTACDFLSPVLEDFGPVRILNVSPDGIGLITGHKLHVGLLLAVTLVNRAKSWSKTVLVRVAHVTAQHGNTFLVGGTFNTPLTYEELKTMVM